MIVRNPYPICEFDPCREPLIRAADIRKKTLPEKCVITFFRRELERFAGENGLPVIGHLPSEVLDIPIYEYTDGRNQICVTMAFCGAPGAAVALEELHAMGCGAFVVCGGAGALEAGSRVGEIIVPVSAVRDEGVSYHYLEPSREVACQEGALEAVLSGLREMGVPFRTGKTWTTDAIYRETPDRIALRRSEGCVTVEMEAAAFFAVSQYYGFPLAQLLYAGDDVSGEAWDSRDWNGQERVRADLIAYALALVAKLRTSGLPPAGEVR